MADDRSRFEALYRATRRDVLAYLVRRTRDPDDAAELLSEVYLTAWRRLDVVPEGEQARLWLFGTARNLLYKRAARRRLDEATIAALADGLRGAQPTSDPDRELQDTLGRALATLSDRDREIVLLNAWEQLTPREIAQVMSASPNAVRIRLHRARSRLQIELGDAAHAQSTGLSTR